MVQNNSSIIKMLLSLTLIAIISAAGLALVYSITKKPIEKAQNQKKNEAIQLVLPNFKGELQDQEITLEGDDQAVIVHKAFANEKFFGAAIETYTNKAFDGQFKIMVGFDSTGTILGTEVLEHTETPGLGEKIKKSKSDFSLQFDGKNPADYKLSVTKDGGDVDAITAATISSRAFCDAVQRAYDAFKQIKEVSYE